MLYICYIYIKYAIKAKLNSIMHIIISNSIFDYVHYIHFQQTDFRKIIDLIW